VLDLQFPESATGCASGHSSQGILLRHHRFHYRCILFAESFIDHMNRRKFTRTAAASVSSLFFTASAQSPATHRPDSEESKRAGGVTREVAEFIVNTTYSDVPGDVIELGKKSILDGLGLALSGSVAETGRLSRTYLKSLGLSAGEATVIGSSMKVPVRFAAFVNGIGIHADDYDDTQLAVAKDRVYGLLTHPTAPVAYHIGAEVECKIAEAIAPRHYDEGFHSTGTCGTFGAAATVAKLQGLDLNRTLFALGIAGGEAAGLRENFGTMSKPFHAGRAAESGVVAADLAELGWTAADKILEAPRGFFHAAGGGYDLNAIHNKLGNPWTFRSPGVSIKPFPSVIAHSSWHDGNGTTHPREQNQSAGCRARERRHEPQYAERTHPSPADRLASGEIQHGVLHVGSAAIRKGGVERIYRRGSQPSRGAEHDQSGPLRHPSGGGGSRLQQNDNHHRHTASGRPNDFRERRFRQRKPG
jgi:hypothetical protein